MFIKTRQRFVAPAFSSNEEQSKDVAYATALRRFQRHRLKDSMTNDQVLLNAPQLRVPQWIDGHGNASRPLELVDLGDGFKVIFCFQHRCPGGHSHGFPTLKALVDVLSGLGFGFVAVQTVFEAAEINTFARLRETQQRYGLAIPFGHDPAVDRYPSLMTDFETRGTPWFIVLDPLGEVIHSDFRLDAESLLRTFGGADELVQVT